MLDFCVSRPCIMQFCNDCIFCILKLAWRGDSPLSDAYLGYSLIAGAQEEPAAGQGIPTAAGHCIPGNEGGAQHAHVPHALLAPCGQAPGTVCRAGAVLCLILSCMRPRLSPPLVSSAHTET